MSNIYRFFYNQFCLVVYCWLALVLPAAAQISITASGVPVTQTFDALPKSSTATFTQNITIPGIYTEYAGTGTTITASDGSAATSALYSFGTGIANDRALGAIGSSTATTGNFVHGLRLKNNTGSTITSLQINYTGEQWRTSQAAAQTISFSYLVSATPITSLSVNAALPASYTAVTALDFTGPISGTSVAVGALNGNLAANRTARTATLSGLSIPAGSEIMLRWYDPDQTGNDHGLAIDDIAVTATTTGPTPNQTLSVAPANITGLSTFVGVTSTPGSYTITGRNLSGPVTLSVTAGIEISNDPIGSIYTPTISITPIAGNIDQAIKVRLTGAAVGPVSATVTNTATTTAGTARIVVVVTGTVGDPNVPRTSIATVRSQRDGTSTLTLPGGKIGGRVTVSSQFGGNLFYMQDVTGGISVFNSTTAVGGLVQLGDSIQVIGTVNTYQGARELDITSYTIVAGTPKIPTPRVISVSQLSSNEGQLVQLQNTTIGGTGATFASTTYSLSAVSGIGTLFIKAQSELNGASKPAGPVTIVGIADRVTSGTATITELFPRILADVSGSSLADQACGGTGGSGLSTDQTFDIATWNIDFFGADAGSIACTTAPTSRPYPDQGPTDEDKQARNVKTILQRLNADIIVNEEVSDEARYAGVVRSLPGSYSYVCSDKFSYYFQNECDQAINSDGTVFGPTKFAQKVCVMYNTATVTPVLAESKPLLTSKYSYPSSNSWESGRLPYLFVADVTVNGQTRKIHVVGIHAKSGSAAADYSRRKQDIIDLKAELDQNYPKANLIMIGDFNDRITTSMTTGQPSSYANFDQDAANYRIITKPLETTGCVTVNSSAGFVDHIAIANELAQAYISNSASVLRPTTGIEGPYASTTSDHNPVLARFNLGTLQGPLTVKLTADPALVTTGTTTLSATTSGGTAPFSYTFTGPGTITLSGNTASVTSLTASGVKSFTVKVSDAAGQTASAITSVTVTNGTGTIGLCDNLFMGTGAGFSNTTGCNNVALGPEALFLNLIGRNNVAVGDSAGYQNLASGNTFVGAKAGLSNTTGERATFVGDSAGFSSNGLSNTFIGYKSGLNTTAGSFNTFLGTQAGLSNTTGSYNLFVGDNAGAGNTTGRENLFLGPSAGFTNTAGRFNTFLGLYSGYGNINGENNVFLGYHSGFNNLNGNFNLFMGTETGYTNTSGVYNTFVGNGAGYYNQTGSNNTLVGLNSGFKTTGSDNVMIGGAAGLENTLGSQNTFLGTGAGVSPANPALINATAIGYEAEVSANNSVVLGKGANVGIGTSAPTAKLEIVSGSAGTSGLKLTNLPIGTATTLRTTKFLTVDVAGNVVLGNITSGAREGETTTAAFWERNGQVLRSMDGNSVVIGTSFNKTPKGYKLFVEEGILTEKVKVALKNTSEWSDYVFATDYRLKPLAEVAAYIRQHRHLPGIPSATEVVEQGVDLGKMNAKLLEKIEELTLYSIQLEQSNQKQQQELQAVKEKQAHLEQLLQELIKNK
ncbi:endonuclease/exonuclease/phosphatase family protein [Spirosoma endbachense]|nr:endonuclease/exonuclease/phosphatase family protein [Spirosoma endbachense]